MTKSRILRGLWIFSKGVIISIAAFFGLMIGGLLASLLGITSPAMPGAFNPGSMLFYKIVSGMVFYIMLGYFLAALKQKKHRFLAGFLL
ncbi:MAG TPA: hypothetical protein DDW65_01970 [Firmicutes bacterium]|jgi:hypothetical protein|nr:hypothetical protein [Bacillota bacterium]